MKYSSSFIHVITKCFPGHLISSFKSRLLNGSGLDILHFECFLLPVSGYRVALRRRRVLTPYCLCRGWTHWCISHIPRCALSWEWSSVSHESSDRKKHYSSYLIPVCWISLYLAPTSSHYAPHMLTHHAPNTPLHLSIATDRLAQDRCKVSRAWEKKWERSSADLKRWGKNTHCCSDKAKYVSW